MVSPGPADCRAGACAAVRSRTPEGLVLCRLDCAGDAGRLHRHFSDYAVRPGVAATDLALPAACATLAELPAGGLRSFERAGEHRRADARAREQGAQEGEGPERVTRSRPKLAGRR